MINNSNSPFTNVAPSLAVDRSGSGGNNSFFTPRILNQNNYKNQMAITVKLTTTTGGSLIASRIYSPDSQSIVPLNFYNLNPTTSYSATVCWNDGSTATYIQGAPSGNIKRLHKGISGLC